MKLTGTSVPTDVFRGQTHSAPHHACRQSWQLLLFSLDLMRRVLAVALAASLFAPVGVAKEQPVVSVSSEPTGLTVESQKDGKKLIPGIDIYSDGSVAIRRYDGSEATKQIDAGAVHRLLAALARTNFYKVTEDSFHSELASADKGGTTERVVITDCPVWSLRTQVGGGHDRQNSTLCGRWSSTTQRTAS